MTSKLADQIRQHPSGTLQNRLAAISATIPAEQGRRFLEAARDIGDHTAGLAAVLSTIGLADIGKAMPKFGRASERVREGTTLVVSETGAIEKIPNVIEPGKSRLHKN
jgi:hypothetical protein